ncbi:glycosyltransferase [Danxiaibacter flavus]|uniref:Glycosyltransferase n=1 Tax=Danxiaibacter flavus TaxID=3049108 RepID=A0ABV3ZKA0_9BACT|nr:glycosyltransferase [Chitinophagaceae bacterium DXS]
MKITILQGAFFPVPAVKGGAVEKIWYKMGIEFAKAGHNVTHVSRAFGDMPDEEVRYGVRYIRVRGYEFPSSLVKIKILDFFYTLRALRKVPKDSEIIVTNTFWAPFILRRNKGRKVYVNVERVPRGQMKFYKHVGMLRGSSPVICSAVQKELSEQYHRLVTFVPNPVPFSLTNNAHDRNKTILFVGRIHPEKGVHVLIEAFSILSAEAAKDWQLVITGPWETSEGGAGEEYKNKLMLSAKNLNVQFTGPVFNDEYLINQYSQASIFCYPAQKGSGDAAPVAPREAMACGCVPVVSTLECFRDIISDGVNGCIYDESSTNQAHTLAKTLQPLMQDTELLQTMSSKAKLISEIYSTKAIANKFLHDFENIRTTNNSSSIS